MESPDRAIIKNAMKFTVEHLIFPFKNSKGSKEQLLKL